MVSSSCAVATKALFLPRRAASLPYLSLINVFLVRLAAQAHSVIVALFPWFTCELFCPHSRCFLGSLLRSISASCSAISSSRPAMLRRIAFSMSLWRSVKHPSTASRICSLLLCNLQQVTLRPVRDKTAFEKSGPQQLAYPFRVRLVRLLSRHILDVLNINHQQGEAARLKNVDHRLPIHIRALHRHVGHTLLQQPSFQFCQRSCRRFELTRLTRDSCYLDCGHDYLLVCVQSATPVYDLTEFVAKSYRNNYSFSLASASNHWDFI